MRHARITVTSLTIVAVACAWFAAATALPGHEANAARAAAPEQNRRQLPASIPARIDRGAWTLGMTWAERTEFLASVAALRPQARMLVQRLDEHTTVRVLQRTSCGVRTSCAIGTIVQEGDVRTGTYRLELFRGDMDGTLGARFLTVHELGHLVDYDALDDAGRAAFDRAFRASPKWRRCFRHDGGCVDDAEVFADQFAMYALGETRSMTAYAVPRLLTDAAFEGLLRRHAIAPASTPAAT